MGLFSAIKTFLSKYVFSNEWRCLSCGKEIFGDEKFCDKCYSKLPFIKGAICDHCGRKLIAFQNYCSTCKEHLLSVDKCRSVFEYAPPVSDMIKRLKYGNQRYLVDYFAERLGFLYLKNYMSADYVTYVPMTKKAYRRRGYNQSELLARAVAKNVNLPLFNGIEKVKETKRQATLGRKERLINLEQAFSVVDRKSVKNKKFVIVDDVTTTGSTVEAVAKRLKRAGASEVFLITVASLSPKDKY